MKMTLLLILVLIMAPGQAATAQIDRYISQHVTEDDRWAYSMWTLGSFHNFMHETMSEIARHDAEELDGAERVPEFENRISGSEWTEYRKNLGREGEQPEFRNLIQITEIMHNRVHHLMYKAVVYDKESRDRQLDLADYLNKAGNPGVTIPDRQDIPMNFISQAEFRRFVWESEFRGPRWHEAMQKTVVFNHMLYDMLTQWAEYGREKDDPACRPPEYGFRITTDDWIKYASGIDDCEETPWRELVKVAEIAMFRIHHMMYKMAVYEEVKEHEEGLNPAHYKRQ